MEKIIVILSLAGLFIGLALLLGYPFMWLWNYVMPEVFGLKTITFWQGVAMQIIASWLFKSSSIKD